MWTLLLVFSWTLTLASSDFAWWLPPDGMRPKRAGPLELETVAYPVTSEPTCDQLRAMWRASKRQHRAAMMTNDIPRFHDPFFGHRMHYAPHRVHNPYAGNPYYRSSYDDAFDPWYRMRPSERLIQQATLDRIKSWREGGTDDEGKSSFARHGGGGGGEARYQPPSSAGSFDVLREILAAEKQDDMVMRGLESRLTPSGEATSVYGKMVFSPEETNRYREKVRTGWGRSAEGRASPQPTGKVLSPRSASESDSKTDSQQVPGRYEPQKCHVSQGKSCTTDADCLCSHKYQCSEGTCQKRTFQGVTDAFGTWYDEPFSSGQLGSRP